MTFFLWFLLSIGIPLLGPIAALALTATTHGKEVSRALMIESIQHGQLYWSCTALSAAAIYEATDALYANRGPQAVLVLAIVIYLVIAIGASIIVMLATTKAHQDKASASSSDPALASPLATPLVKTSLKLTGFVALSYAFFHGWLD